MIDIQSVLGGEAEYLLGHACSTISREVLYLPGSDFVNRVAGDGDRKPRVLRNLQALFDHGRLAGSGYLSVGVYDELTSDHPIDLVRYRWLTALWGVSA